MGWDGAATAPGRLKQLPPLVGEATWPLRDGVSDASDGTAWWLGALRRGVAGTSSDVARSRWPPRARLGARALLVASTRAPPACDRPLPPIFGSVGDISGEEISEALGRWLERPMSDAESTTSCKSVGRCCRPGGGRLGPTRGVVAAEVSGDGLYDEAE